MAAMKKFYPPLHSPKASKKSRGRRPNRAVAGAMMKALKARKERRSGY